MKKTVFFYSSVLLNDSLKLSLITAFNKQALSLSFVPAFHSELQEFSAYIQRRGKKTYHDFCPIDNVMHWRVKMAMPEATGLVTQFCSLKISRWERRKPVWNRGI
ncbi:MAG: hypothetical protein M0Z52_00030 [Actinomycetota bacterium]|nr:hypothetical protein [Actinomycetota bacterium]